jgi:frataxin-like iron-binding protein CyaY
VCKLPQQPKQNWWHNTIVGGIAQNQYTEQQWRKNTGQESLEWITEGY